METQLARPAFLQSDGPVLLQGAMDMEIRPYVKALQDPVKTVLGDFVFWQGRLGRQRAVLSRTGIGTAAAAAATALGCQVFRPAAILNQGSAGGYGLKARVGDLVIGTSVYNGNAVFTDKEGVRYLDLGRLEHEAAAAAVFPAKPPLLEPDAAMTRWLFAGLSAYAGRVSQGVIASSDQWNDDPDLIARREALTGALCEEMEAAAVVMTAARFGVPCGLVRVLSNNNRTGQPFDPAVCGKLAAAVCRLFA